MKSFDFNAVRQPVMRVTLPDEASTKLMLTAPSTKLVERLSTNAKELREVFASKDAAAVTETYRLVADVLSCNREGHTVTLEQVRKDMTTDHIIAFIMAYLEFLTEIRQAKN